MPRDLDAALSVTPTRPTWTAFDMYGRHFTHLVVAQSPATLITLCGLHLPAHRRERTDLLPAALTCSACRRRLEPGGPELLTPDNVERLVLLEVEDEPALYPGDDELVIRTLGKRIHTRWDALIARMKGDPQA